MTRLSERALLVKLTIHQWGNTKQDKGIAQEVAGLKGASQSQDRYLKTLIGSKALSAVSNACSRAYNAHNRMTLPWHDGGIRILPSEKYMEYVSLMNTCKSVLDEELDRFLGYYPQLVLDAKNSRGGLFDPTDYPNENQIKNAYGIDINFMPFPDAEDFRADLSPEEITKLKDAFNKNSLAAIQQAIVSLVEDLQDRLEKDENDPSEWTKRAARAARTLNLDNDPVLENLCQKILGIGQ